MIHLREKRQNVKRSYPIVQKEEVPKYTSMNFL